MPRAWASARVVAPVPSTPRGLRARRRRPDLASRLRGAFPRPGSTPSLPRWRRPRARATPDDDAESAPGSADPAAAPAPPPGSYAGWWTRADAVAASAVAADRAFDDDAVRLDDATRSVGAVRAPSAWWEM